MGEDAVATRASTGSRACSPRTAAGARSTSTTRATGSTSCPFCDFGYVIDPPSEDVTAHALEALAPEQRLRGRGRARARVPAPRAAGGRLLVGPLGREPRLRHRRRAAGARGLRVRARSPGDPPGGRLARLRPGRKRRLRRGHPLLPRARLARPRHSPWSSRVCGFPRSYAIPAALAEFPMSARRGGDGAARGVVGDGED